MATTPEQNQQAADEFSAAFNGADPEKKEMTEDEAFGLGPETPAKEAAEPAAEEKKETPTEESSEAPGKTAAEGAADGGADGAVAIVIAPEAHAVDEKDQQREKSWEGRLKAREEALKAREEALATKPAEAAEGETPEQETAEGAVGEKIEEVAEQVASGDITAEAAMKILAADFGKEFTQMLGVLIDARATEIAGKLADEKVSGVKGDMDGLVNEIVNDKARAHAESIADAHPDFMDVAQSPEFRSYIDSLPASEQESAKNVIERGSARQIIKLLSDFKGSKKTAAEPAAQDDTAIDAAEGVRSRGMKLPDEPKKSDDYEAAWDQF